MMRQALTLLALACILLLQGTVSNAQLTPEAEDELIPVVAVTDTGGPSMAALEASWTQFRANWPNRPFCLLQVRPPGGTQNLLASREMLFDTNFIYLKVNRDMNDLYQQSDWYDLCQLYKLTGSQVATVALLLEVQLAETLASYNFFETRTSIAGLSIVRATPNGDFNYIAALDKFFVVSGVPSTTPSINPSQFPSNSPSQFPSGLPTSSNKPSESFRPSMTPSKSLFPSSSPSMDPSRMPSSSPSTVPSTLPSVKETTAAQLQAQMSSTFGIASSFTVDQLLLKDVAAKVANSWSQVITGNLQPMNTLGETTKCGAAPAWVDDVWVCYDVQLLDDNVVATVSPGLVRRNGKALSPITGEIVFDWRIMYDAVELETVAMAAMTHMLGVGTLWDGLVVHNGDTCTYPLGTAAAREYQQLSACQTPIPMEHGCGDFDNDCFIPVNTTSRDDSGVPLSPVVLGFLEDMQYTVDYTALGSGIMLNASCTCNRRDLEVSANPGKRRLSEEGRAKAIAAGRRALLEKDDKESIGRGLAEARQEDQMVTEEVVQEQVAAPSYFDIRGKITAVLYREEGSLFTVIVRGSGI